jgi:hypothetical protein
LKEQSLRDHHSTVLNGIRYIILNLGYESKYYLNLIFPPIIELIQLTEQEQTMKEAFDLIQLIIKECREGISKFSKSLYDLINTFLE